MDFSAVSTSLLVVALTAIAVGALIKGMTGVGLPLLAVPAIAAFTSVEEAVVLMIIPTFGSNLWLVINHRRFIALLAKHKAFLIAGFFGGIVGTVLLNIVDDRWLKLTLAAWLALYLLQFVVGDFLRPIFQARGAVPILAGMTAGSIQGTAGFSAQIVAPYFHSRDVEPEPFAFVVASAFLVFSFAQLVTAFTTELFTPGRLAIGLAALVPTLVLVRVGIGFAGRISTGTFHKLLVGVFVLMEIKLLADVFGRGAG